MTLMEINMMVEDKDDDNDGILDSRESRDIDEAGYNRLDRDSDGDGCPDTIENNYPDRTMTE